MHIRRGREHASDSAHDSAEYDCLWPLFRASRIPPEHLHWAYIAPDRGIPQNWPSQRQLPNNETHRWALPVEIPRRKRKKNPHVCAALEMSSNGAALPRTNCAQIPYVLRSIQKLQYPRKGGRWFSGRTLLALPQSLEAGLLILALQWPQTQYVILVWCVSLSTHVLEACDPLPRPSISKYFWIIRTFPLLSYSNLLFTSTPFYQYCA